MVSAGVGLAIMPETAARRGGRSSKTAFVRLADDWATRRLSVCVRAEEELSPPARGDLFEHLGSSGSH